MISDQKPPAGAHAPTAPRPLTPRRELAQQLFNYQNEILASLDSAIDGLTQDRDPEPWRALAAALMCRLPESLGGETSPAPSPLMDPVDQLRAQGATDLEITRLGAHLAHAAARQVTVTEALGGEAALDILGELRATVEREIDLATHQSDRMISKEHHELMDTMGHMKVAVFRAKADSRLISVNQAGADILGASEPAQLFGIPFAQFYTSPADRELLRRDLQETGQVIGRRLRARRLDGEFIWIETNILARVGESGKPETFEGFGMDVTALAEAEEEIRKLNQFLGVVIDNANVWLNVLDQDAKVVIWNQAAEAISGYGREEVLGTGEIWNLLYPDPEYRQKITKVAAEIIQGAEVKNFETTIQNKSGEARTISWHSRKLTDEQGNSLGSVALGRDITTEKALQQRLIQQDRDQVDTLEKLVSERTMALEQANRELKLHDMTKDRFLANISHELRTPLVSGLGYVGLILEGAMGPLSQKARKGLRISHRNLKKLEELIDDLLTFTQHDVEQRVRPPAPFGLSKLVKECVVDLQGDVTKQLDIKVEIEPGLPALFGDREQIGRVFVNILTNAVKFTGTDAEILIQARQQSPDRVEVRISDNGIGVPAHELELIFDRLYRSTRTNSNAYRGTGIGLSLVKEIIINHQCTVKAEDRDGPGTTITFTLPLTIPEEGA